MEELIADFRQQISALNAPFHRYMYSRINWENRMIGLTGPRGVGKTTLFLQHIKEDLPLNQVFYVMADDIYFSSHLLLDLAREFYLQGGKYLFIDEVHKYADWSRELKLIYDKFPQLRVAFTGSSILDINKGAHDLSRRAVMYSMQGLSFREYLALFHDIDLPAYTLEEIVNNGVELPSGFRPLSYFKDYLQAGYYPFALESDAILRTKQIINLVIEADLPQYAGINVSTCRKIKKLLGIIARSVPFKPNYTSISQMLEVSRASLADYMLYLEQAGFIAQLRTATGGVRGLGKVEKIYLDNPSLAYAISEEKPDVGNVRETFFFNQMRVNHDPIASPTSADFKVGDYTFEIGGQNKKKQQIKDTPAAYVVKDDTETGWGNSLALWQFGMTY